MHTQWVAMGLVLLGTGVGAEGLIKFPRTLASTCLSYDADGGYHSMSTFAPVATGPFPLTRTRTVNSNHAYAARGDVGGALVKLPRTLASTCLACDANVGYQSMSTLRPWPKRSVSSHKDKSSGCQ